MYNIGKTISATHSWFGTTITGTVTNITGYGVVITDAAGIEHYAPCPFDLFQPPTLYTIELPRTVKAGERFR